MSDSILLWIIAIPFIGGLIAWQGERISLGFPRWIALGSMLLSLGLSVLLWLRYEPDMALAAAAQGHATWMLEFRADWIPRFGISLHFAVDGLALLLVNLTGILGVMAVACSWREIQRHIGFFYLNLIWNLAGVFAVFMALDLFLFFFFWEMMLVPMFFLIALWGHNAPDGKGRIYAATKFFIFTQASGLLMLLSILALVFVHHDATGAWSFDYMDLLDTHRQMAPLVQMMLMLGFFVAFMVKLPVVPFHTWLPDAHSQAPTAGSVDLAGVLLKTAAYGYLRFALPLFPDASASFAPVAIWLGVIGVIYGAFMTFAQNDIKRLVAYSSVSHMGFVMIGIYAGTPQAMQGAVITMLAHGVSAGALFILCGEIYERIHTRDLRKMGGLWSSFPYLPPIAMFFTLAALGLPGLGNFVGEFLVLLGTFQVSTTAAVVAATGLVWSAVYALLMIARAFHGPAAYQEKLQDLNGRELATLMTLAAILLWLGVYPQPVLDTAQATIASVQHVFAAAGGGR
ncbi:MAG TPA: NADH-quinone oxidoreductase subunit M [Candidatus Binatia bacterium]|nr:NADH-quinone oxidoreductase subunit M [Candidatus Binatia bacterium]